MRENRTIKTGVGAVVFRGQDVLLIRRGKEPFLGQWSIPGGALEFGETLEAAVTREVREETAVEIRLIGLIDVFEAVPGAVEGHAGHVVMIDYAADWTGGEPRPGDDAAEAEFVSVEEALRRLSWDKTRQAIRGALAVRRAASKPL